MTDSCSTFTTLQSKTEHQFDFEEKAGAVDGRKVANFKLRCLAVVVLV